MNPCRTLLARLLTSAAIASLTITAAAETIAERDARMAWWREARFGMFIHWGLYSVAAGEWDGKPVPGHGEWIMNKAPSPSATTPNSPRGSIR